MGPTEGKGTSKQIDKKSVTDVAGDLSDKHDGVDVSINVSDDEFADSDQDEVESEQSSEDRGSESESGMSESNSNESSSDDEAVRRTHKNKRLRNDPEVQEWLDSMVKQRVKRESRARSKRRHRHKRSKRSRSYGP